MGHILFVAENILKTPEVWDEEVPDGDPNGYGKTFKERAVKYLELCDQTLRDYLVFCDMDNTLLTAKEGIPSCNRTVIKLFTQLGGRFTVATASFSV